MRTSIFFIATFVAVGIMGCMPSPRENYDFISRPGHIACEYTENNLVRFTDIVDFTRLVDTLIYAPVGNKGKTERDILAKSMKFTKNTDKETQETFYSIHTVNYCHGGIYTLYFHNTDTPTWKITGDMTTYDSTIFFDITIDKTNPLEWKMKSKSYSKFALYTTKSLKHSDISAPIDENNEDFNCENETWTINWTNEVAPAFYVSGKGYLESVEKPELKINYNFELPMKCLGDAGNNSFNTSWVKGLMELKIYDSIDNVTDTYKITFADKSRREVARIIEQ